MAESTSSKQKSEATIRSFAAPAGRRAWNRGQAGATDALMGAKTFSGKAPDKIILSTRYLSKLGMHMHLGTAVTCFGDHKKKVT